MAEFARDITERFLIREKVRATLKELTAAIPTLVPISQRYPISGLTSRERAVATYLAGGKTTKEVARDMSLSVKTVETHRAHLFEKLGVRNVIELTRLLVRENIVSL